MIDIHSHVLPGVDDGAGDMETALEMLRIAEADGISHIVVTPHFIQGEINNTCTTIMEKLDQLVKSARSGGINLSIYPGSEVFICPMLPQLVSEGTIQTINGSSYVLVELPMASMPQYTKDVFYQLKLQGYTPILAHPERNMAIAKNPGLLVELIERGVLSQVNATSITGLFGRETADIAMRLIEHDLVHFISSDAHTCRGRSPKLAKSREIIAGRFGRDMSELLFEKNGLSVLKNEEICIPDPKPIKQKKSFWFSVLKFNWG